MLAFVDLYCSQITLYIDVLVKISFEMPMLNRFISGLSVNPSERVVYAAALLLFDINTRFPLRESIPRQVDKKSGSPGGDRGLELGGVPEEIGVWNSQGGGKDKHLFFLYIP